MTKKQQILRVLQDADSPVSTNAVATQADIHWDIVNDNLHELHDQGKVDRHEVSNRLTLWWDRTIPL